MSRKHSMVGKACYKLNFHIWENLGKRKEMIVFRMAFKRSGVRLPLAPPILGPCGDPLCLMSCRATILAIRATSTSSAHEHARLIFAARHWGAAAGDQP